MHPSIYIHLRPDDETIVCPVCQGFGEVMVAHLGIDYAEIEDVAICPQCLGEGTISTFEPVTERIMS